MSLGTCTGGQGHHSQFGHLRNFGIVMLRDPLCEPERRARRRPLTLLWSLQCNALVCQTMCPHHQHRHERMYKNKDFWLKTSWRSLWSFQTTVVRSHLALTHQVELPQRDERDVCIITQKKSHMKVFWMGLYAHCMCAEYLDQSSAHKRNIFLYSVDPTCTKLNHCVCIG